MRKKMVFGLGALCLLVLVLGCSILGGSKSTEGDDKAPEDIGYSATEGDEEDKSALTESGEAFLNAIKEEDYQRAFDLATEDFPGETKDFEQWLTDEDGMPQEWQLYEPEVDYSDGGLGAVAGDMTFADKEKGKVELTMHKTDTGYWRVDDITLTR